MFNSLCWWRFIVSIPVISELTQKLTFMAMQQGAELSGNPVAAKIILNLLN